MKSTGDNGWIGAYLHLDGGSDIDAAVDFIVRDAGGRIFYFYPGQNVNRLVAYGGSVGINRLLFGEI